VLTKDEPKKRDVTASRSRFTRYREDDRESERQRTIVQAMFDGEAPFPQEVLNRTGAGYRTNVNMGLGKALLNASVSSYTDLVYSPETLMRFRIREDVLDAKTRADYEDILAEEVTEVYRDWADFDSKWEMLSTIFAGHGVGFGFFPKPTDWRWDVASLDEVKMPRRTKASEDAVERLFILRDYTPHELYTCGCEDPGTSKQAGWDPKVVEQALAEAVGNTTASRTWGKEWADYQVELKNNDLTGTRERAEHIRCVIELCRERDGKYSQYIFTESALKEGHRDGFLFAKKDKFDRATQAFVAFIANQGNGYFHGIRGLGYSVFPAIQVVNQQWCREIDRATIGSSILLQPTEDATLDQPPISINGPVGFLNPQMKFVETKFPNNYEGMPLIKELMGVVSNNSAHFRPPTVNLSKTEKTKYEVQQEGEVSSALTISQVNIFTRSWGKLLKESWFRIAAQVMEALQAVNRPVPHEDPMEGCEDSIRTLIERLQVRGIDPAIVQFVDKVEPVTSVGRGSPQARQMAFEQVRSWWQYFDEDGKNQAVVDFLSQYVGRDRARRYVPPIEQPRSVIDEKIAIVEHGSLREGLDVPVLPSENHFVHVNVHLSEVEKLAGQYEELRNSGQDIDFERTAPEIEYLQAILIHTEPHLNALGSDELRGTDIAMMRKRFQNLSGITFNLVRQLRRWISLQQAEAQNAEGEADPALIDEMRRQELKLRHLEETHRAKLGQMVQKMQVKLELDKMQADQRLAADVRKNTTNLIKNPL
jgi:hypothetical protein